jgi:hypothetical protein
MDFQDHLDNMTSTARVSASKALDYLDGAQKEHLEAMLSDEDRGIKDWRKRGVMPIIDNVTKKIIERSAVTYTDDIERGVWLGGDENDAATEKYNDLLGQTNHNVVIQDADQVARLLKVAMVMVQVIDHPNGEQVLDLMVLHRGNCDVDVDRKTGDIRSLIYQSCGCGPNRGELFHYWTPEKILDIERKDGTCQIVGSDENKYGVVPVVPLWDVRRPRYGFWPKAAWEELIALNDGVNMFHTEVAFNARFQAFGALFSNAEIENGQAVGPDAVVSIIGAPGETPFVEYRTPDINLEKFQKWLNTLTETVADSWGVNLKVEGAGGAESGFKLVVEEVWNLELQRKRQRSADNFEKELYRLIARISDVHNFGIPSDGEVYTDFPKPAVAENLLESWTIDKEKIALGVMSVEDYWLKEDPSLSPEDIAARKAGMGGRSLPAFDVAAMNQQ